jgi:hypothetical protein
MLGGVLGQQPAAVAASLLVTLCALTFEPSGLLFAAAMLALLGHLDRVDRFADGWLPAAVAGVAALLVQVRFAEGVALAIGTLAAAGFAPARRWLRLAIAGVALVGGVLMFWLLAGQAPADLVAWLREMRQVADGYGDAMSLEARPNVLPYLLIAATCAVVAGYLIRLARHRPARITVGIAVLAVLMLYLGFRESTGRHGPGHQRAMYLYALPVLVWAVSATRKVAFRLGVVALAVLLTSGGWLPLSPAQALTRWNNQLELLVDPGYQASQLQQARRTAQQRYQLSEPMRAAVAGAPVTIDPWETTLAWAYDLNWRPAPVFQSYVAYTAMLDTLNATALATAGADQRILRATGLNSIDGRNRLWDPPRYLLTELCDYRPTLADARWLLLRKDADRCGPAEPAGTQRVAAGQPVTVPAAPAGSLLVLSFRPDQPNLAVRLGRLLDKSFHPLRLTADGTGYRLPRQLAGGPLIMQLPLSTGWPAGYGGGTAYRTVSFNEAGQATFSIIPLH